LFFVGGVCGAIYFYIIDGVVFGFAVLYVNSYCGIINTWELRTHLGLADLACCGFTLLPLLAIYARYRNRLSNFLIGFYGATSGFVCYYVVLDGIYPVIDFHFDPHGLVIGGWEQRTGLDLNALLDPGLLALVPCLLYVCLKKHIPKFAVAYCISIIAVSAVNIVTDMMFPDY